MTTDDSLLYHYCSCNAFAGIVSTKSLWLSDLFSTNDSEEHRWLRKLATEVIESEVKQPTRAWDEATLRILQAMPVDCDEIGDIYLGCFSRRDDSLGQWRAYAGDGHGVAIGFSKAFMAAKQERMGRRYLELLDVVYERDRQRELVLEGGN